MKRTNNHNPSVVPMGCFRRRGLWLGYAAALAVLAVFMTMTQAGAQQTSQSGQQPANASGTAHPPDPSQASKASPPAVPSSPSGAPIPTAANTDRKKRIADESASLLKLATDLKAEVDKTTKDTLSLNVIRKADEIEKLAHNVKEQTKVSDGSN